VAAAALHEFGHDLQPGPTSPRQLLRDIWRSRDLVSALARKNFYVRYRRAVLGVLWAGAGPLLQALTMSLAFGVILNVNTGSVPYPVFVLSGLVGWSYLASTMTVASTAIVDSANLASRIYFPRAINVLVQVATSLYGFGISLVVLFAVAIITGYGLSARIVYVIPAALLMVWLTASFALCIAAVHVYLRDVRQAVGAVIAAWFYVTPVVYPTRRIPNSLDLVVNINPATGMVQLFRAAIVGPAGSLRVPILVTCAWAAAATCLALFLHCRNDRNFADLL
jgi:lipopolysaccharide transport system permease protein